MKDDYKEMDKEEDKDKEEDMKEDKDRIKSRDNKEDKSNIKEKDKKKVKDEIVFQMRRRDEYENKHGIEELGQENDSIV